MQVKMGEIAGPPDMETFNVTIIGQFNRHIIEPGWAGKHKIVPEGSYEILMPIGGMAPVYQLPGKLNWTVLDDRLLVSGNPASAGQFVEKLLKVLVHTPLRAVGINFKIPGDVKASMDQRAVNLEGILAEELVETSESRSYVFKDGVKVTVVCAWSSSGMTMSFNAHLDARNYKKVISHCLRTTEFKEMAERLVKSL